MDLRGCCGNRSPSAAKGVAAPACAALVVALVALCGCKGKKADIAGIGPWMLDKTTLAASGGICSAKDALTWCYGNPAIAVGNQSASVDLYFRGHKNAAPLDEILLAIRDCQVGDAAAILTKQLGKPDRTLGTRKVWRNHSAVIVAQLPADDHLCEISFVSPKDKKRIAELTGKKAGSGAAKSGGGAAKAGGGAAKAAGGAAKAASGAAKAPGGAGK